jgi:hypothetical protein
MSTGSREGARFALGEAADRMPYRKRFLTRPQVPFSVDVAA